MTDTQPSGAESALDLLPCPFCGGAAHFASSGNWHSLIAAHRNDCILSGDSPEMFYMESEGVRDRMAAKWNTRAALARRATAPQTAPALSEWHKFTAASQIDFGRRIDVVLTNGVYEYDRLANRVDWTQVQDWRYAAQPVEAGSAVQAELSETLAKVRAWLEAHPAEPATGALVAKALAAAREYIEPDLNADLNDAGEERRVRAEAKKVIDIIDASSESATAPAELPDAIPLLKRLKRQLEHARRFSPDTMQTYRAACAGAEGDIEEFLNEHRDATQQPTPTGEAEQGEKS